MMQRFLELGCQLEDTDQEGSSAWHAAAEGGNFANIKMMAEMGIDIQKGNRPGCTALSFAARAGELLPHVQGPSQVIPLQLWRVS